LSNAGCVKILATVAEVQAQAKIERRVLVPTMGALHRVHGELIRVG
jgi:pantothenate synthetase